MKGSALHPRAEELLVERALRPLDDDEQWELEELSSMDDDSFDRAAAAIVIATSAAESLPQHLANAILAAAPQPDFKRTLPGVIVEQPLLPRDTMVGVDIASFQPDIADKLAAPGEITTPVERVDREPGSTAPIPTAEPIVTFTKPSGTHVSQPLEPIGMSRHSVTAPPPQKLRPPMPAVQDVPSTDHLGTLPPPPPREQVTGPHQPIAAREQPTGPHQPVDQRDQRVGPRTPQPSIADQRVGPRTPQPSSPGPGINPRPSTLGPDQRVGPRTPQPSIADKPATAPNLFAPTPRPPSQPFARETPTGPQPIIPRTPQPFASPRTPQPSVPDQPRTPQPYAGQPIPYNPLPLPPSQPFPQREPLPLDTQPQPAAMRGIPLPTDTLPPGSVAPLVTPIIDMSARRAQPAPQPKRRSVVVPWLAAAACLLVAGGAVWWALQRETGENKVAVVAPPTPEVERKDLLGLKDTSKITWTPTADATSRGATGDVVWNQTKQTGFMRFVGLTPNNPKTFQYQLWIFDKDRDQAFPVDGGVFDVSSTGEVLVKISPKLAVVDATLFAVTIEKPGGVVVSKRERIVVTATRS